MSVAFLQANLITLIMRRAAIVLQLTNISDKIALKNSQLLEETDEYGNKKEYLQDLRTSGAIDDTTYESYVKDVDDDYNISIAKLNSWETKLENEKTAADTELAAVQAYIASFQSGVDSAAKSEFKYGYSS